MLYYLIENEKLYKFANYEFDANCLTTDIITKEELQAHPNKVIVDDIEIEVEIIDPETGEVHTETRIVKGLVLNPNYEQEEAEKEKERIAKLSLTKREVFLALYHAKQITPDIIKAQIGENVEALIEFEYAEKYYRFNPLIDTIGAMLGYSSDDLDYLFEHKEFPTKEE